jgi:hypothetical protein
VTRRGGWITATVYARIPHAPLPYLPLHAYGNTGGLAVGDLVTRAWAWPPVLSFPGRPVSR